MVRVPGSLREGGVAVGRGSGALRLAVDLTLHAEQQSQYCGSTLCHWRYPNRDLC